METTKISNVISYLRKKQKINQAKLAKKSGVDRAHFVMVERGKRSVSLDLLEKISPVLNVETYEIIFLSHFNKKEYDEALEKIRKIKESPKLG